MKHIFYKPIQGKMMKKHPFSTILLSNVMWTTLYAEPVKIDLKHHSNVNIDHYRFNSPSELIIFNHDEIL
jgi:hypothetical protein